MAKSKDTASAARVQAAFTTLHAEVATTDTYTAVEFEFGGGKTISEIRAEHAVSLELWALSTTQDSLIKVEHKPCGDFSEWRELVAETTLTGDAAATVLHSDVLRAGRIRIMVKESVAGGTVEVGGILK